MLTFGLQVATQDLICAIMHNQATSVAMQNGIKVVLRCFFGCGGSSGLGRRGNKKKRRGRGGPGRVREETEFEGRGREGKGIEQDRLTRGSKLFCLFHRPQNIL